MPDVVLFRDFSGDFKTETTASIQESGDLLVSGWDMGEVVRQQWGDSDAEFFLFVRAQHKEALFASLPGGAVAFSDRALLARLAVRFTSHSAWFDVRRHLEAVGIPFRVDRW